MEKSREHKFIFRMLKEALTESEEEKIPDYLDWDYIYRLCKYQKIDNLIAFRLEKIKGDILPKEIRRKFAEAKQVGMAREATQYFALEEIKQKFEENGIKMIPLKGSRLKAFYPSQDMRFLTDLDILCLKEDKEKLDTILKESGYWLDHAGNVHDVYVRKPFMTVEIHWSCRTNNEVLNTYFEEIWEKSSPIDGYEFLYQMSWEDFYLFMIAHLEKHLKWAGIGIRMLLDLFVFEQKIRKTCDNEYINTMLEQAGLAQFEKKMTRFIVQCFEAEEDFFQSNELVRHVLENGAQGTKSNNMSNRLLVGGTGKKDVFLKRMQIIFSIIFPPMKGMKVKYPYLEKYPFLLPTAWLQRIIISGLKKPKECKKILKEPLESENVEKMRQVYKQAGVEK